MDHMEKRREFSLVMLCKLNSKEILLEMIVFTDEIYLDLECGSNRQNDGYCRYSGEQLDILDKANQRTQRPPPWHTSIGLNKKHGIIGPFFLADEIYGNGKNITAAKYVEMLKQHVILVLKEKFGSEYNKIWFQQDSATVYTAEETITGCSIAPTHTQILMELTEGVP